MKKKKSDDGVEELSIESLIFDATGDIVDEVEKEVDIITFCEHPFYLDQSLHGQERFIMKTIYGIPLDDIDKSIQDAFNTLIAADNNGQLDTVEELTSFRDKMYADLDMSITGFSDASIAQMKFLV